jgi:hypothetical protein
MNEPLPSAWIEGDAQTLTWSRNLWETTTEALLFFSTFMGEKIKTLSSGLIAGQAMEIELNHPVIHGHDQQVHVQTESFRVDLDKKDYLKFALSVLVAEKNLKLLKKI